MDCWGVRFCVVMNAVYEEAGRCGRVWDFGMAGKINGVWIG